MSTSTVSRDPTTRVRTFFRPECLASSGFHHSLVHPLLDQGMVLRQLDDPPVAHQVGPAVAHVSDEDVGRTDNEGDDGRPHAVQALVGLALLQDGLIRGLDGRSDSIPPAPLPGN